MTPKRILICLVLAFAALAPVALANDADVRRPGTCTGASSSKIKLSPENGRIEAEFEVDQNRNGVRWHVTMRRNGKRAVSTNATTHRPSGSFEVRRVLGSRRGPDTIAARAKSPAGEVCTARATIG